MNSANRLGKEHSLERLCTSRFQWLQHLHLLFPQNASADCRIPLDTLVSHIYKLTDPQSTPLSSLENYSNHSKYFTASQIMQRITSIPTPITWDKVFDALTSKQISLKVQKFYTKLPQPTEENYLASFPSDISEFPSTLLYLNISSNKLQEIPELPEGLRIVNVSNNLLKELRLPRSAECINANNNEICKIVIEKASSAEEMYLSHNQLGCLTGFSNLPQLSILDISENFLLFYEDLAVLSLNPLLQILSVKGNPVFTELTTLPFLSQIKQLDPESIFQHSKCQYSHILFNQSFQVHKRTYTLPIKFVETPKRQPCKANILTPSQVSRASSPSFLCSNYTTKSVCYNSSPLYKENISEKKILNSSQRRSSSTLITVENITNSLKVKYGNPIAALMIKPGNKRRLHRKK